MFRPQLTEAQQQMLKVITDGARSALAPEFPPGTPLNHGIGGIINMEDVPGKRPKGSMMWLGMCNGHWVGLPRFCIGNAKQGNASRHWPLTLRKWIDLETGIAATLFVNILPHPDIVVNRLYDELEKAMYGELCRGKTSNVIWTRWRTGRTG